MTETFYVAVKASPHAFDSAVFGLSTKEFNALFHRFSDSKQRQVVNGHLIEGNPLAVINALAELGYRVVCSSGEAETVWTLKREALQVEKYEAPVLVPVVSPQQSTGRSFVVEPPVVSPQQATGRPFVVQPPLTRESIRTVERIGTKEWLAKHGEEESDKILTKHISSIERIVPGQKVILKTNLSSEFNPLSKRPGPRGGPFVAVPVARNQLSQDETPFPPPYSRQSFVPASLNQRHSSGGMAHQTANPSVAQTLDEMDFERGLWYPAIQGDLMQIENAISKGADVNRTDKSGYTPLHYAVRTGDVATVKLLLKSGANVNVKTKAGLATPLHRAAAAGHLEVVKLLLAHGADKLPLDADGRTPLHRSAEAGHKATCVFLLNSEPRSAEVRDVKGLLPKDVAAGSVGTVFPDITSTSGNRHKSRSRSTSPQLAASGRTTSTLPASSNRSNRQSAQATEADGQNSITTASGTNSPKNRALSSNPSPTASRRSPSPPRVSTVRSDRHSTQDQGQEERQPKHISSGQNNITTASSGNSPTAHSQSTNPPAASSPRSVSPSPASPRRSTSPGPASSTRAASPPRSSSVRASSTLPTSSNRPAQDQDSEGPMPKDVASGQNNITTASSGKSPKAHSQSTNPPAASSPRSVSPSPASPRRSTSPAPASSTRAASPPRSSSVRTSSTLPASSNRSAQDQDPGGSIPKDVASDHNNRTSTSSGNSPKAHSQSPRSKSPLRVSPVRSTSPVPAPNRSASPPRVSQVRSTSPPHASNNQSEPPSQIHESTPQSKEIPSGQNNINATSNSKVPKSASPTPASPRSASPNPASSPRSTSPPRAPSIRSASPLQAASKRTASNDDHKRSPSPPSSGRSSPKRKH